MPDFMPFEDAAGFLSAYGTAYHALVQRGGLAQGERLLVLGAGSGVGVAAVQLGKALGAYVIAAASSTEKLAPAISGGVDETLTYPSGMLDGDQARTFTAQLKAIAPGGVDVICDIVGGPYTEAALRAIAWEGRLLVIGFPAGIATLPMNLPLLKGCQIIGVFYGSFIQRNPELNRANIRHLLKLYEDRKIVPLISGRFPLDRAIEAFRALEERRAAGRIVITPAESLS
jgi:NADPH2:quinone reductase